MTPNDEQRDRKQKPEEFVVTPNKVDTGSGLEDCSHGLLLL